MNKIQAIFLIVVSCLWLNIACATEHVVTQDDKQFSEIFLKIEHDDVIRFVNLDNVEHKLTFTHRKLSSLETEVMPGDSQAVVFSKPGVYDVKCDIHPHMKMTVFVPHIDVVMNQ